jgi:hypothetical protein
MLKRKIFVVLAALMAGIGLVQCSSNPTPEWPILGNESRRFDIDPNLLQTVDSGNTPAYIDPYFSPEMPWQFYERVEYPNLDSGIVRSDVMLRHYRYVTVAGHYHGTGTYVYYLPREDIFYLWGDDFMGHHDGIVGPFQGDPRIILPEAGSLVATGP